MEEEIEYVEVEHDARQDVVVVAEPLRDLPRVEYDKSRKKEGPEQAMMNPRRFAPIGPPQCRISSSAWSSTM